MASGHSVRFSNRSNGSCAIIRRFRVSLRITTRRPPRRRHGQDLAGIPAAPDRSVPHRRRVLRSSFCSRRRRWPPRLPAIAPLGGAEAAVRSRLVSSCSDLSFGFPDYRNALMAPVRLVGRLLTTPSPRYVVAALQMIGSLEEEGTRPRRGEVVDDGAARGPSATSLQTCPGRHRGGAVIELAVAPALMTLPG